MVQLLRNALKQELRGHCYWNGSSSCLEKRKSGRERGGLRKKFDRSLLDCLLWKEECLRCVLPSLSAFPLSSFSLMRGKNRRWDRKLSAAWCPGTLSPAWISSASAASLRLDWNIYNMQITNYCSDLCSGLFGSVHKYLLKIFKFVFSKQNGNE